jgi:hypothetical protein
MLPSGVPELAVPISIQPRLGLLLNDRVNTDDQHRQSGLVMCTLYIHPEHVHVSAPKRPECSMTRCQVWATRKIGMYSVWSKRHGGTFMIYYCSIYGGTPLLYIWCQPPEVLLADSTIHGGGIFAWHPDPLIFLAKFQPLEACCVAYQPMVPSYPCYPGRSWDHGPGRWHMEPLGASPGHHPQHIVGEGPAKPGLGGE